jgi:hypothetical protein
VLSFASFPVVSEFLGSLHCFTDTHWQNVDSTKLLVTNVIVPFFRDLRIRYNYEPTRKGLLMLDIWYSHIDAVVLEMLEKENIKVCAEFFFLIPLNL